MDVYTLAKFLHVALAIVWLGGGFILMLLGALTARRGQRTEFLTVLRLVALVGTRVFVPGSLAVLALGLVMVWLGGWSWDAWIVIGLAGFAAAAGIGAVKLGPTAEAATRLMDEGRLDEAEETGRTMFRFARIEYVIQAAIVFAMVTKPNWHDLGTLSAMGLVGAITVLAILLAPAPRSHAA